MLQGCKVRFSHFDLIPHMGAGLAQADESICIRGVS